MKSFKNFNQLFDCLALKDGVSLSFHHHLRNGDAVMNTVLRHIKHLGLRKLKLYPSSVFPTHHEIVKLVNKGRVYSIATNYINGPLSKALCDHPLEGNLCMQSHGGRARALLEKDHTIDVAFIAAPAVDQANNATGLIGKTACGSLGYAMEDVVMAKTVVLITDTCVDTIINPQIHGRDVDYVVVCDSIGDPSGILSGTTKMTDHPLGVKIARSAAALIDTLDLVQEGFSFQSGAGGISLRVTAWLHDLLKERALKASFFSGGITKHHVAMLEANLVKKLYDVQCFDLESVKSLTRNPNHIAISASDYANPNNRDRVIKNLDFVILGATEFDLDFNVNVTTDSFNTIIGGSGGHSDTAEDAKVTIIVTPLIRGRMPVVKERVTTITTPGQHIDVIVTERGIAINPARQDLLTILDAKGFETVSVETLLKRAHALTGIPEAVDFKGEPIGTVESRHGETLDTLHAKKR